MLVKKFNKIISIILLFLILLCNFQTIFAIEIGDSAKLKSIGNCNRNVEFKFDSGWSTIKCDFIAYSVGDTNYPAYCIRHRI